MEIEGGNKLDKKACFYSVVRYVPDQVRNEPRNIGIIVQCRGLGYINCKFMTNLRAKLGGTATQTDIKIIKAYIEEFSDNFKQSALLPSTGVLVQDAIEILQENYLSNLTKQGLGKIHFTEPRGCLTDNPVKELEYFFNTFVGEETFELKELAKHSQLKTEIKNEFKKIKLLSTKQEKKKGFQIDVKIPGGRSRVEHLVDFALSNGKLYVVETVDMRKKDKKIWTLETFEAAVKFDDLMHGLSSDKIEPYSVVAFSEEDGVDDYLKILNSYSRVFRYTDENEKNNFLSEMSKLVISGQSLFHDFYPENTI